jgi:hypothetical protein
LYLENYLNSASQEPPFPHHKNRCGRLWDPRFWCPKTQAISSSFWILHRIKKISGSNCPCHCRQLRDVAFPPPSPPPPAARKRLHYRLRFLPTHRANRSSSPWGRRCPTPATTSSPAAVLNLWEKVRRPTRIRAGPQRHRHRVPTRVEAELQRCEVVSRVDVEFPHGCSALHTHVRGSKEEREYREKGSPIPPPLFPRVVAETAEVATVLLHPHFSTCEPIYESC